MEAAPAERFSAPAEVRARVPEVTVERVRLFAVVEMVEAPKPVMARAPEVEVKLRAPEVRVKPVEN